MTTSTSTTPLMMARPAAMSGQCDAHYTRRLRQDGTPVVCQCQARATRRIIINSADGPRTIKRCKDCYNLMFLGPAPILSDNPI